MSGHSTLRDETKKSDDEEDDDGRGLEDFRGLEDKNSDPRVLKPCILGQQLEVSKYCDTSVSELLYMSVFIRQNSEKC